MFGLSQSLMSMDWIQKSKLKSQRSYKILNSLTEAPRAPPTTRKEFEPIEKKFPVKEALVGIFWYRREFNWYGNNWDTQLRKIWD